MVRQEKGSFVGVIVNALVLCGLIAALSNCTVKIDNPFYAPSTLDVNKNTSSGAANYLKSDTVKASRQTE